MPYTELHCQAQYQTSMLSRSLYDHELNRDSEIQPESSPNLNKVCFSQGAYKSFPDSFIFFHWNPDSKAFIINKTAIERVIYAKH